MRRVQDHARSKNSIRTLLNPQMTLAARLASFLFPPLGVPEEYDHTTLKFPTARKQAAFPMRVVSRSTVLLHH
jgi:hypothetical protein